MDKKNLAIYIAVGVVCGALGFFGGIKYQQSKTPAASASRGGAAFGQGQGGTRGAGAGRGGANFVSGTVLSKDANSITVKNQAGGSKIIILGSSTQYLKSVSGTSDDVTVGANVIATGTTNADGSLTAQNVQLRNASSTPAGIPQGK